MRPGDTPRFRAGLHSPQADLNELAEVVGQLAGIQVAPPLRLDWSPPAGPVLSLVETPAGESDALPLTHVVAWFGANYFGGSYPLTREGVFVLDFPEGAEGYHLVSLLASGVLVIPAGGSPAFMWHLDLVATVTAGQVLVSPEFDGKFARLATGRYAGLTDTVGVSQNVVSRCKVVTAPATVRIDLRLSAGLPGLVLYDPSFGFGSPESIRLARL